MINSLIRKKGKILSNQTRVEVEREFKNSNNCKFPLLDDNILENINSEEKAYLLGWIASAGSIKKGKITIAIDKKDEEILNKLKKIIDPSLNIKTKENYNIVCFSVSSQKIVSDVCSWLGISAGEKSNLVAFPKLSDDSLKWAFLRGYFDSDGSVAEVDEEKNSPSCNISTNSASMRNSIVEFTKIPCHNGSHYLEWWGDNALEFLSQIYKNATIFLERKYNHYHYWNTWVPGLSGKFNSVKLSSFHFMKTKPNAVSPVKHHAGDSGYDLTIIDKQKEYGKVTLYGTGIKVRPEHGWYIDIVPRSSIIKTGYILANSVGVIDRTYRGEIMIALMKIDDNMPDIELPCKLVQMIPRPIVNIKWEEVESFDETQRSEGGFGHTGK